MISIREIAIAFSALHFAIFLPVLLNYKVAQKAILNLVKEKHTVRILGMLNILFAFLILSVIWRVDKTWEGLIALLGWLVLARGLIAMWWPDFLRKIAKKLLGGSEFTVAVFLLVVIGLFGVGVGYLGLFHF